MISKSDIKYTFRLLAKSPGFTLLSILVLAGGLGVSILAFTFNYTMLYKPIPLQNGESIFHICAGPEPSGCRPMKAFEFAEIRDNISTLENIGIFHSTESVVDIDGVPVSVEATSAEWNMFQLSQTRALIGRGFLPIDQQAGAEAVMVLGYEFWQQHFNGEPDTLERVVNVNGVPTRIVGVMPEGYRFPWAAPLWLPVVPEILQPAENGAVAISTYGLLKPGISAEESSAEVANLMQAIRARYPSVGVEEQDLCRASRSLDCDTGHIATFPLGEFGGLGALMIIILTGLLTGFIFLLAAINVGTLLLSRTNERMRDTSIRVALGAPRRRLLIQMMGESIVIAVVGAAIGILLAATVMEFLNILLYSVDEQAMAFWQVFEVDASTIYGALIMVIATVIVTSAIPSWRIINGDFNAVMRDGTRGARGLRPSRFNRGLVVVSITIITLLSFLVATGGTFAFRAKDTFLNIDSEGLLVAQPRFDEERFSHAQTLNIYRNLNEELLANPNIRTVYFVATLGSVGLEAEDSDLAAGRDNELAFARLTAGAGDLTATGVSLLEGRLLLPFENPNSASVVVISESLANQLWPGESAIGQRIRVSPQGSDESSPWREVVGVVSDLVTTAQLISSNQNAAYLPLTQTNQRNVNVQLRAADLSSITLANASAALSRAILTQDPAQRSVRVFDVQQQNDSLNSAASMGINLSGATAAFAFLVAIAGIFGLTRNFILSATQEIGTRRALGASDILIRRTFMRRGGKQALLGFSLASLLMFPISWLAYISVGMEIVGLTVLPVLSVMLLLYAAILYAIYQPIHQILRMEPSEALRHE